MSCPQPDDDRCTDQTPCSTCPHCGDTWQQHIDGNPCSTPAAPAAREETR